MARNEYVFKISVVGAYGTGKTSLINRFIDRGFQEDYKPTLGANIVAKDVYITVEGVDHPVLVRLVLWDIAGQERYDAVRAMYFQGCAGCLFIYDVTRPQTFEEIKTKWLNDFTTHADRGAKYVLIGNKIDLEDLRQVTPEDGQGLAREIGAVSFIEASAKTGENVNEMFNLLTKTLITQL
jgi:small GTP-binding protein